MSQKQKQKKGGGVVQWVKAPATKPDDPSSVPGPPQSGRREVRGKLFSNLHIHTGTHV